MFLPFHGVLSLTASGRLKKRSASANAASTRSSAIGWSTSVLRAQAQASSAHPDRDLGRARGREEAEEEGTHKNPTSEAASMSCCRISSLRASKSRRLICGTPTSLTSMVAGMSSAEGERWKGRGRGGRGGVGGGRARRRGERRAGGGGGGRGGWARRTCVRSRSARRTQDRSTWCCTRRGPRRAPTRTRPPLSAAIASPSRPARTPPASSSPRPPSPGAASPDAHQKEKRNPRRT